MPNRDIYLFTKSNRQQNSNSKIKVKEIGAEIKPLTKYTNAIIVFDAFLGAIKNQIN